MNYSLIIPSYNEAAYLPAFIESLAAQTLQPSYALIVDDNSTDATAQIVARYTEQYPWLHYVRHESNDQHAPGSKVINAFNFGLAQNPITTELIGKIDADLIFPASYFETLTQAFTSSPRLGLAGGFCYIPEGDDWMLENLTNSDHVRGALKLYRKTAFEQIHGLDAAMGWDTADEIKLLYHGWQVQTYSQLHVKHCKPTGASYTREARKKQGKAFYRLGYGLPLTCIASLKLALRKKQPLLLLDYLKGYWESANAQENQLVTEDQAAFMRRYRWRKIRSKLGF